MSEEQYQTILATLADVQVSVDSIDRGLERLAIAERSLEVALGDQDLGVPDWINSGARDRVWSEISEGIAADDRDPDYYASSVALVVVATIAAVASILFMIYVLL